MADFEQIIPDLKRHINQTKADIFEGVDGLTTALHGQYRAVSPVKTGYLRSRWIRRLYRTSGAVQVNITNDTPYFKYPEEKYGFARRVEITVPRRVEQLLNDVRRRRRG